MIRAFILLAVNPIVASNMSHEDYAIVGFFLSFGSLFGPLLNFGFLQYYSKCFYKVSAEERNKIKTTLVSTMLIYGIIELIIILIGFSFYINKTKIEFSVFPYALLAYAALILNNFFSFHLLELKMSRRAGTFFKVSVTKAITNTSLVLLFVVLLKLGAFGKLFAPFVSSLLLGIYSFRKISKKICIDYSIIKDAIKFSWPLIIAGMLGYFSTGIDRAMLINLNDTRSLGLYNIAIALTGQLMIFKQAISMTFQPDIFKAVAQKSYRKLLKIVVGLNLLNLVPVIIFIFFAPLIFDILTHGKFNDASRYARILALRNVSSSVYFSMSSIITAFGYSKITLVNKIIGSILIYFMYRILIHNFSFVGAAWGQVVSFLIMGLFSFAFVSYKYYSRRRVTN